MHLKWGTPLSAAVVLTDDSCWRLFLLMEVDRPVAAHEGEDGRTWWLRTTCTELQTCRITGPPSSSTVCFWFTIFLIIFFISVMLQYPHISQPNGMFSGPACNKQSPIFKQCFWEVSCASYCSPTPPPCCHFAISIHRNYNQDHHRSEICWCRSWSSEVKEVGGF